MTWLQQIQSISVGGWAIILGVATLLTVVIATFGRTNQEKNEKPRSEMKTMLIGMVVSMAVCLGIVWFGFTMSEK